MPRYERLAARSCPKKSIPPPIQPSTSQNISVCTRLCYCVWKRQGCSQFFSFFLIKQDIKKYGKDYTTHKPIKKWVPGQIYLKNEYQKKIWPKNGPWTNEMLDTKVEIVKVLFHL